MISAYVPRLERHSSAGRRRYFFGADAGAEAAFFCAFCFLVLEVFFGLLSPMAQSFLKIRWRIDGSASGSSSHASPPQGLRERPRTAVQVHAAPLSHRLITPLPPLLGLPLSASGRTLLDITGDGILDLWVEHRYAKVVQQSLHRINGVGVWLTTWQWSFETPALRFGSSG